MSTDVPQPLNASLLPPGFAAALSAAWCAETCWEGCRPAYPADGSNPAYGNCLVSVLAAWAAGGFAGSLVPGLAVVPRPDGGEGAAIWHFRLRRAGAEIDPTWQQFAPGTLFWPAAAFTPEYGLIVRGSLYDAAAAESLERRLSLLLSRMGSPGGWDGAPPAGGIIARARQSLAPFLPPPPAMPFPAP